MGRLGDCAGSRPASYDDGPHSPLQTGIPAAGPSGRMEGDIRLARLRQENIEIPFPTRTIHVHDEPPKSGC
jgi:hypothetical protein